MLLRDLQRILKILGYCLDIQDTATRSGEAPGNFLQRSITT